MAEQNRTTLKSYFETNDYPTESQFSDLIDSCENIADDGVLVGGEDDITAYDGGGQANAYQLTKAHNRVSTAAQAHDSIKLPVGVPGMICSVWNDSGYTIDCYPATGGQINEDGANVPVEYINNQRKFLVCYASNLWVSGV